MAKDLAAAILDVSPSEVHITVSMQTLNEEPAPREIRPTPAPAIPTRDMTMDPQYQRRNIESQLLFSYSMCEFLGGRIRITPTAKIALRPPRTMVNIA